MSKKYIYIIIGIILSIALVIYFYNNYNSQKAEEKQKSERLSAEIKLNSEKQQNEEASYKKEHPLEIELSSFSTPLLSKSSGRLNNIRLTCERLNETVVTAGDTFSFYEILGPSTAEKGYQKADVIAHGDIIQAVGGGNCQVSTTLYNAVLASEELEVVERHEHGKDVAYVEDGKDAAVAYGSMDFKFKNTSDKDIKMYLSSDDEYVYVRLVRLEIDY